MFSFFEVVLVEGLEGGEVESECVEKPEGESGRAKGEEGFGGGEGVVGLPGVLEGIFREEDECGERVNFPEHGLGAEGGGALGGDVEGGGFFREGEGFGEFPEGDEGGGEVFLGEEVVGAVEEGGVVLGHPSLVELGG